MVATGNIYLINKHVVMFFCFLFFFSIWVLFHEHSRITGLQGKGEGISLTPHHHFYPLHRQLDISRAITAESSPYLLTSVLMKTSNLTRYIRG